jgi:hypothetical protein
MGANPPSLLVICSVTVLGARGRSAGAVAADVAWRPPVEVYLADPTANLFSLNLSRKRDPGHLR